MAKQRKLYFSKTEDIVELPGGTDKDGNDIVIKKTIRELELSMLTNLFLVAMDIQKKRTSAALCYDCVQQLENIDDENEYIELTKEDIKFADSAFEYMVEKRPRWWTTKCDKMLEQFDTPKPEEE